MVPQDLQHAIRCSPLLTCSTTVSGVDGVAEQVHCITIVQDNRETSHNNPRRSRGAGQSPCGIRMEVVRLIQGMLSESCHLQHPMW